MGHQQQQLHNSQIHQQQQFLPVQHPMQSGNHNGMNVQAAMYDPNTSSHAEHPTK
jgi:hypothetical protein